MQRPAARALSIASDIAAVDITLTHPDFGRLDERLISLDLNTGDVRNDGTTPKP